MATGGAPTVEDAQHCTAQLREHAPDLYFASLLLPERIRADIVTLHAFHTEITGIALAAPEPLAGEIRLQWWMDVLNEERGGEALQNPLARALLAIIAAHDLPADVLIRKLEAHVFDLYSDSMGDTGMLEGYLGETRSALFQLGSMIADPEAAPAASDASGYAGVATGYVAVIENLARHRAQHRVHVPSDILAKAGTSADRFLADANGAPMDVVWALVDVAQAHYERAIEALDHVSSQIRPVFAPLALVPVYLKRTRKRPEMAFTGMRPISQLRRQWATWRW